MHRLYSYVYNYTDYDRLKYTSTVLKVQAVSIGMFVQKYIEYTMYSIALSFPIESQPKNMSMF